MLMITPQLAPFDLHGLVTYELQSRPSKVFADELGKPIGPETAVGDWLDSLPKQLAGQELRAVRDQICRAATSGKRVAVAFGGHVIKTGCGPYLIDWIHRG